MIIKERKRLSGYGVDVADIAARGLGDGVDHYMIRVPTILASESP